jgi:hypothetical protein
MPKPSTRNPTRGLKAHMALMAHTFPRAAKTSKLRMGGLGRDDFEVATDLFYIAVNKQ